MKTFIFPAIAVIVAAMLCISLKSQARPQQPSRPLPRRALHCAPSPVVNGAEGIKVAAGEILLSGTISSVDPLTNKITMSAEKSTLR